MAEVLGHAFVDNLTHYGDPWFVRSPLTGLVRKSFARARAATVRMEKASARPIMAADPWPHDDGTRAEVVSARPTTAAVSGTSQMTAVDRWGNMATICTSLGYSFGSLVTVPGTGVVLLSSMHNFDARPGHPNSIAPGKMPIFAAPVLIVLDGDRPLYASAGSGGYRIETGCLHTLVNTLDHRLDLPVGAAAPRVQCQGNQTFVDERMPTDVQDELAARGHQLVVQPQGAGAHNFGRVVALHRLPDGTVRAGTDPIDATGSAVAS
jgi:gamma-glutamyltranspeptidase/glutathione hydrolase